MRKFFSCCFLLVCAIARGQEWHEQPIDSLFSVSLPSTAIEEYDSTGKHMFIANEDDKLVMVTTFLSGAEMAWPDKETDLINQYNNFREGFIKTQGSELIKSELVSHQGLKVCHFSASTVFNGNKQIRHCEVVFVNRRITAFMYWLPESRTKELASEVDRFFASVKVAPGLGLGNQVNSPVKSTVGYRVGYIIGRLFFYGIAGAILFGLAMGILWIRRRNKLRDPN